eukprot:5309384-Amphidinium_carterae.1
MATILKCPTSQVRQLVAPMRKLLTDPGAHASQEAEAPTPPLEYQFEGQKEQSSAAFGKGRTLGSKNG